MVMATESRRTPVRRTTPVPAPKPAPAVVDIEADPLAHELLARLFIGGGYGVSLATMFERTPGWKPPTWAAEAAKRLKDDGLITVGERGVIHLTPAGKRAISLCPFPFQPDRPSFAESRRAWVR